MSIPQNLSNIKESIPAGVTLVAVSKTKPVEDIQQAYAAGHRVFGENKIQEMAGKYEALPKDISWHMIGHLQRNKVKYMAHFVDLIHGVDSFSTLKEIDKQAKKHNRIINCLLQVKIASEETKFGLSEKELLMILNAQETKTLSNVRVKGLMGMASFTDDQDQVKNEFSRLKTIFENLKTDFDMDTLSMGMSGDFNIAIEQGSNMVRVGSAIFGERHYIH